MINFKVITLFFLILPSCLLINPPACAQKVKILTVEMESNLPLQGTVVEVNGIEKVVTGLDGIAVVDSQDTLIFKIQRLGFKIIEDTLFDIRTKSGQILKYQLEYEDIFIEELEVIDTKSADDLKNIGASSISKADIDLAPSLLGEADVLRAIRLLPGLQSAGEGTSGYYVRGGSVDQNLVLIDNATIFNPNHLFGFFSVFNPYAIGKVDFKKGGFSPAFGGRVSSILDVKMINPSQTGLEGNLKVSSIASSVSLQAPIVKNKLSLLVAARRTYIDKLASLFLKEESELRNSTNSFFFDINSKLLYRPTERDVISFTSFYGQDGFNYNGNNGFKNKINWHNHVQSLNWVRSWNKKISQDFNFNHTDYEVRYDASLSNYLINIYSSIRQFGVASNLYLEDPIPNHDFTVSYEWKKYRFIPNTFSIEADDVELNTLDVEVLHGIEAAVSINNTYNVNDQLTINIGGRQSFYSHKGPFDRFITDPNLEVTDTISYTANEKIKRYSTFEPRLSMLYAIDKNTSLKLAYDVTAQYVHLAPVAAVSLPTDVWVPSSDKIAPQRGVLFSAELSKSIPQKSIDFTTAIYHKSINNVVEYQNGILLGYGTSGFNYDDNFLSGQSFSMGLELSGQKKWNKLEAQFAYTLSKTERKFKELNKGLPFPAKYDSRHNGNLRLSYQKSKRLSFNAIFNYSTGNAITLPVQRYIIEGNVISDYAGRNNFRLPAYHRLDLSVQIKNKKNGTWNFSLYNAYNRRNPYFVFFDVKGDLEELELSIALKQVSLFPIIPGISYALSF